MPAPDKSPYLSAYADILKELINRIFQKYGKFQFSQDPEIHRRDIMEYQRHMRVSGLEKFNAPAYVAAVSLYRSQKDAEIHHACGVLVVYILDQNLKKFFEAVGITGFDEDDPEAVMKKCVEFSQTIAAEFKQELIHKGYPELFTSPPAASRNTIDEGVEFSFDQYEKAEVGFFVKKVKSLVLDITLVNLPHR